MCVVAFDQMNKLLGHGSGFILTGSGVVVTNRHVVEQAREANGRLAIILPSGTEWTIRNAVNADVTYLKDLTIVRTGETCQSYLRLADSSRLRSGQQVYAIGTPLSPRNFNTVTSGTLLGLSEGGDLVARVEAHPGSSGGPLVDERGQVVGVIWAGHEQSSTTLAITSNALGEFVGAYVRQVEREENARTAEHFFSMAERAEEAGNVPTAIKHYKTALAWDPRHEQAHFALGRLYQKTDPSASLQHYTEWLKLAPGKYPDAEIARIRAHVQSLQHHLAK